MTTTLFAIFVIALVAAMAWVITRIVNIFVEIEELKDQAKDLHERLDKIRRETNDLLGRVKDFELSRSFLIEGIELQNDKLNKIDDRLFEVEQVITSVFKKVERKLSKSVTEQSYKRKQEYEKHRKDGMSIRKAGEEVGVSYVTAKRYEKQLKAQSNENGDN